jgi:biotin carboxyl carrier protein
MYSISVNGKQVLKTDLNVNGNNFEGTLNGAPVRGDFVRINSSQYHVLFRDKSYNVEIHHLNTAEKTITLKVNSVKYQLALKDKYDELLHSLGLDKLASKAAGDIKAPKPGMVLNILVKEGDAVKKGDPLIVLEAMKMENILKSPSDGTIKKVNAIKGTAVEKNQLLIQF